MLSLLVLEDLAMAAYLPIATVLIAGGAVLEATRTIAIAGLGISAGVEPALGPLVATYVLITAIGGAVLTRFADRVEREPIPVPAEAGP